MALSDEQNAMLRLLAQGEQGYGDIAALMGLKEDEVRAKVVGALAQLEAEGKPAPDVPPPIAGGAKPAAEVDPPEPEAVTEVPDDPDEDDEPAVAEAVAPQEPVAPSKPQKSAKPSAAKDPKGAAPRTITLPTGRGAWLLGGGVVAAVAVIVAIVLLIAGGGGDDSSSSPLESSTANTTSETGSVAEGTSSKAPTQAELTAVDGSEAKGLAAFGRVKNKLALQVEATGLQPTEEGTDSYTIWLAQSPRRMLPLASIGVKSSGKGAGTIAAQFEVPVEVLAYLAGGTFDQIAITKTDNDRFETSVSEATKAKRTPAYTGEAVLRGMIVGPIIGLAQREEAEARGE